MIADRHPLVVRQQRVVGAEQLADVGGVVDADIEVGVVADAGRQVHRAVGGRVQQRLDPALLWRACGEQLARAGRAGPGAGPAPRARSGLRVGPAAASAARPASPSSRPVASRAGRSRIIVADRDPAPRRAARRAEDAQRQVLDREVGVTLGRGNPAAAARGRGWRRSPLRLAAGSGRSASSAPGRSRRSPSAAAWMPAAKAVTRCGKRVSNMKAMVPSSLCGFSSALLAPSKASRSGPCGSMVLCSEQPPGTKPPPVLAS